MPVRGIRGAIQIETDTPEAILQASREVVLAMVSANPGLVPEDVASIFFTVTDDLRSAYPASTARELPGWGRVPLLCAREIPVPSGMPRCLRFLIHWNTNSPHQSINHVYLGVTANLRPDLT